MVFKIIRVLGIYSWIEKDALYTNLFYILTSAQKQMISEYPDRIKG